jgi:hypothetical protein
LAISRQLNDTDVANETVFQCLMNLELKDEMVPYLQDITNMVTDATLTGLIAYNTVLGLSHKNERLH